MSLAPSIVTIFDNIDCALVIIESCWFNPNLALKFSSKMLFYNPLWFALLNLLLRIFYKTDSLLYFFHLTIFCH